MRDTIARAAARWLASEVTVLTTWCPGDVELAAFVVEALERGQGVRDPYTGRAALASATSGYLVHLGGEPVAVATVDEAAALLLEACDERRAAP